MFCSDACIGGFFFFFLVSPVVVALGLAVGMDTAVAFSFFFSWWCWVCD